MCIRDRCNRDSGSTWKRRKSETYPGCCGEAEIKHEEKFSARKGYIA